MPEFSYTVEEGFLILSSGSYQGVVSEGRIQGRFSDFYTDGKVDYPGFVACLSEQKWDMKGYGMTCMLNGSSVYLELIDEEVKLTRLKETIDNYLESLFDRADGYYEDMMEYAKEITDDNTIIMNNGKKYKVELVEID